MKKHNNVFYIIIIVCLATFLPSKLNASNNEEYFEEMRGILNTLRHSREPMPELLKTLKNELKSGSLSEKELQEKLSSSLQELKNIQRNICLIQPRKLVEGIEKTYNPIGLIRKLETILLDCGLSYKSANINYYTLHNHLKRGYMALALENLNKYKATNNDIYWFRHLRCFDSGNFSSEEFEKFKTIPWDL